MQYSTYTVYGLQLSSCDLFDHKESHLLKFSLWAKYMWKIDTSDIVWPLRIFLCKCLEPFSIFSAIDFTYISLFTYLMYYRLSILIIHLHYFLFLIYNVGGHVTL